MSGYRTSSYDPEAYEVAGPPLRPYNWVQWVGVASGAIGVALALSYFAGELGWMPTWIDSPAAGIALCGMGSVLINSRRAPGTPVTPEQRARNRRALFITLGICGALLGVAAAIEFTGV